MTAPDSSPNTPAVGLVFDINPADPRVISVLVGVATLLLVAAVFFRNGISQRRSLSGGGVGGEEEEEEEEEHEGKTPVASRPRYNTRGHRVGSPPGSSGSPAGKAVTPQQAALCEVLYDVYAGVVPARGIESKTVRECHLSTAEIRRQFKNIKQAREAAAGSSGGSSSRSSASLPTRPATRRAASAAAAAKKSPQPSPGKQRHALRGSAAPPMKPPVSGSPRRTPAKRGGASRPAASSPRSVKRPAASPSPSKAKASVLPSSSPTRLRTGQQSSPGSPMSTRGKSGRTPSVRIGSPKSTPTKRAAAAGGGGAGGVSSFSSPRSAGGTPSKRGKPSVLEIARREAQQQAADVASTRASDLRGQASSAGKRRAKS